MNLLDINLVSETVVKINKEAIQVLIEENLKETKLEVLSLTDLSVSQKELSTGNHVLIARFFCEYPSKMIKTEVEEYSNKASRRLETLLEELISSGNKMFSIKSSITKYS